MEGRLRASVRRTGRFYEIDAVQAEREWAASTDPLRGGKRHSVRNEGSCGYAEARRLRTISEADLLALELAEREAQLLEAVAAERERRREAERVINAFMALPVKLSDALATETDASKVHAKILESFRAVLLTIGTAVP